MASCHNHLLNEFKGLKWHLQSTAFQINVDAEKANTIKKALLQNLNSRIDRLQEFVNFLEANLKPAKLKKYNDLASKTPVAVDVDEVTKKLTKDYLDGSVEGEAVGRSIEGDMMSVHWRMKIEPIEGAQVSNTARYSPNHEFLD